MPRTPRLIVIGGGSGGLAAARAARFRGAEVTLVQEGPVGGECTFTGCVPSKTLLSAGAAFVRAMDRVGETVSRVAAAESAEVLKREGIDVVTGRGRVSGPGEVTVTAAGNGGERRRLSGEAIVLSPGSRAVIPPVRGIENVEVLTNENLFDLRERPRSVVILGGGPIGCEMALALVTKGVEVTVVEALPRLLSRDDPEASEVARRCLERSGVVVRTGTVADQVRAGGDGVEVVLGHGGDHREDHQEDMVAERLLVAVGRRPGHDPAELTAAGIDVTATGWIAVDPTLETSVRGVYAVGDAVGGPQFTHAAAAMARLAVDNALRVGFARARRLRWDPSSVPWVTFLTPEIAQVGLTEADAAVRYPGARVARLPIAEVDRAVTAGSEDGFIKLIAVPRRGLGWAGGGRLVGATIVADRAGEMISEVVLAMTAGMFAGRLAQAIHPYPTWSVGLQMAATQFLGTYAGRTARPARAVQGP